MVWNKLQGNGILSLTALSHHSNLLENWVDHCIYLKVSESKFIILILYVDDILLPRNDLGIIHKTSEYFKNNMIDMREATFKIGIEIYRDKSQGLLRLSQKSYIKNILTGLFMEGCRPQDSPMIRGENFSKKQSPRNGPMS